MDEQDSIPTARMHWSRLVLGRGHPITIIVVLVLVGAGVCWFSLQEISTLTKTPTRYTMQLRIATEGCDNRSFALHGDIGSFGPSFLQLKLLDDDDKPVLVRGCRLRSIGLRSNLTLEPISTSDGPQLIRLYGANPSVYMDKENGDTQPFFLRDGTEIIQAAVVDRAFRALNQTNPIEVGPSFDFRVGEDLDSSGIQYPNIEYEVTFSERWQPIHTSFSFQIPENVKTYFSIDAYREDREVLETQDSPDNSQEPAVEWGDLEISISFRTDDVSVVRGSISDSGDAKGIGGQLLFGIENSDAESRRESGNVRYSAVLGIGIALLVEAFVILLAIGLRALASRLAR